MLSKIKIISCLFFILLQNANALDGLVVGIADGDTLTLLDADKAQHKIRLSAIDAPEAGQPFGSASKKSLSDLCFGQAARADVVDIDRYGRSVAVVYCRGVDTSAEMVRRGMAWVYVKYAKNRKDLPPLQERAKTKRLGLWSDSDPIYPSDWRKAKRLPRAERSI